MKNLETLKTNPPIKSNLEILLKQLQFRTSILKALSFLVTSFTVLNVGSLGVFYKFPTLETGQFSSIIWRFAPFVTIIILFIYEKIRQKGNILFSEISEEFEWFVRNSETKTNSYETSNIKIRESLRAFAQTTNLPFISEQFAMAFYFLINLVIFLLMMLVL